MSIELLPLPAVGFATEPLPSRDGYRFSLTTLLSTMLLEAERLFGPRDMTFTPVGIEFYGNRPFVWYPGNANHISIILTDSARTDPNQAIFQLAHEVVHLLAPNGGGSAPVVEEGLSAIFQQRANENYGLGLQIVSRPYIEAARLANELLRKQSDIIISLRKIEPSFGKWTPRFLIAETGVTPEIATQLCEAFIEFETRNQ